MKAATFQITENNSANRKVLKQKRGYVYLIFYKDIDSDFQIRAAGAIWDGEKFEYCKGRFFAPIDVPQLEDAPNVPLRSRIIGWSKIMDWRQEDLC